MKDCSKCQFSQGIINEDNFNCSKCSYWNDSEDPRAPDYNNHPVKETNPHSFTIPDSSKFDESKIVMDYSVIEKWHQGWKRNLESINEAVIHHIGGDGDIETLKKLMLAGERSEQYKQGIAPLSDFFAYLMYGQLYPDNYFTN